MIAKTDFFGFYSSKRKQKRDDQDDDEEARVKTVENGCDGVYNTSFSEDEPNTRM